MSSDYSDRSECGRLERDAVLMADEIASHIPRMWRACSSPDDFWFWYVGEVDSVLRQSRSKSEQDSVQERFAAALVQIGVVNPQRWELISTVSQSAET